MRTSVLGVLLLWPLLQWTGPAAGQTAAFDVASIVPSAPGTRSAFTVRPSGIAYTGATLADCILAAYQISRFEVSGPASLRTNRFDITTRTTAPATKEQLMAMLQGLLADRFGLRLHREPREMRALALTRAPGGPKLTPGDPDGLADIVAAAGGTELKNHTMLQVAHYLSRLGPDLPVVDTTGITGRYNVQLVLAPPAGGKKGDASVDADTRAALAESRVTAFGDALRPHGLRLESRRVQLDVLVVDRAEMPSAN